MTTCIEYGVKLTDGQKSKLASAIRNKSLLTLRLKNSHLRGSDELMLTRRQITKIKKSLRDGTGSDIKISRTQIRRSVKHGGNLFTSLAATGVASALGDIGIKKLFGRGITIPKKFFTMLPPFAREFTKAQINQINRAHKSGGRLVIKPTRKQIEGGFLGTLASIGIPMAISLLPKLAKLFSSGSGLQVARQATSNTRNVYVPPPVKTHGEGHYPYQSAPFFGNWNNTIGMGAKKSPKEKDCYSDQTAHSIQFQF